MVQSEHTHPEQHVHEQEVPRGLSSQRVQALADGIFAIAMTLLVFNIHVPASMNKLDFWGTISKIFMEKEQLSVLIAYVMSFMLLGVHWVSHHAHFQYIKYVNRTLLWINILYFMFIAFVPFTTQLVGSYWIAGANTDVSKAVVVVYGVHLMCISGVTLLHWWYGTRHSELTNGPVEQHVKQSAFRRILVMPLCCLLALALALINPLISIIVYLLLPVYYILPGHIDLHWRGGKAHGK